MSHNTFKDSSLTAEMIFAERCEEILKNGQRDENPRARWSDGTPAYSLSVFGVVDEYDLSKEFPIITLRHIPWKNTIKELLWIWQKKSNNINDLGLHIWDQWADENGSIGKAYGYQLGVKHKYPEGEFDQVDRLIYDLKNNTDSRRILTNLYNHHDLHEMSLYPCAYSLQCSAKNGVLNAILNQRSQDMIVANNWNVVQYAVLIHMLADCIGLKTGKLIHVIGDCHIYDRHIPIAEKIIDTYCNDYSMKSHYLLLNHRDNFYDYVVDDFSITDEFGNPYKGIPLSYYTDGAIEVAT